MGDNQCFDFGGDSVQHIKHNAVVMHTPRIMVQATAIPAMIAELRLSSAA